MLEDGWAAIVAVRSDGPVASAAGEDGLDIVLHRLVNASRSIDFVYRSHFVYPEALAWGLRTQWYPRRVLLHTNGVVVWSLAIQVGSSPG